MKSHILQNIIKKFFENEDLSALANAIPRALLVMNEEGNVIFANQSAREMCCIKDTDLTPFISYKELIKSNHDGLIAFIDTTFAQKQNITQYVACADTIYQAESQVAIKGAKLIGVTLELTNVTETIFKEKQHELLYQISSALSKAGNLNQVLKVAITQIMRSLKISGASIMLLNEQNRLIVKISNEDKVDAHTPSREFALGEGLAGRCASEQKPFSVYDVSQTELFAQRGGTDKGALLVVPMVSRGRLIGVINVSDDNPRYFTETEVQFLTIMANDIAIALENNILNERLKQKAQQLSKLMIVSSFTGLKTLDNRIQRMVKLVAELLNAADSCVYIYSASRKRLVLKYQKDIAAPLPLQITLDKPSLSTEVLFNREVKVMNNLQESPDSSVFKKYHNIHNLISCPIEVNQQSIGVIHVINKMIGNFDEEDQHLLRIVAHRIGIIIENAQLIRKVEAEKDLLDNIIRNTGEGVAVLDRKKRIIIWNQYLEDLTGLTSTEVVGLPCYKILYSKLGLRNLTQQLYTPLPLERQAKLAPVVIEEEMTSPSREKVWLSTTYSHIMDANQVIENTILVIRNISKEKEFIEAKNEFVSLATHELRTPLTAIKGYLSMILKGDSGQINAKQLDYFTKAYQATERLVVLVEELLDVTRIDEERIKLNISSFSINQIIQEAVEDYSQKAKSKNITLHYNPSFLIQVQADPDKTKQIISNLLDNAIKYTKDKGEIKIYTEVQERDVLVSVHDTGVGIPPKYLNKIFDRFVRAPNSLSVKAGGTGLGLYIVKNLVEKQKGKIWVTSQLGKETTFYFTLPMVSSPTALRSKMEEKS